MTLACASTILIFTLLQRCSAEIATDQPTWFAANAINDPGFLPKPLADIFPTDKTFSTIPNNLISNPIVVLSSTTESTTSTGKASAPTSTATSIISPVSTSTISALTSRPSTGSPRIPSTISTTIIPPTTDTQTLRLPTIPLQFQDQQLQPQSVLQTGAGPNSGLPPNYFFVYQQGPQPIPSLNQNLPPFINDPPLVTSFPCVTFTAQTPIQTTAAQGSTPAPQQGASIAPLTASVLPQGPRVTSQGPPLNPQQGPSFNLQQGSAFNPQQGPPLLLQGTPFPPQGGPFAPQGGPFSTVGPFPQGGPFPSQGPFPQGGPVPSQGPFPLQGTQIPPINGTVATVPFIRIRMQSPSGSITNVNVNPVTTTRRPTTTRRRRRRNNYDDCVDACGGRRTPVCAAPLATRPINPDNLKGFPSICHMACHNSFRKNLYEKVIDGRCGRLRTRIQTVDSGNKLKRDELNRVQYTVVQNPNTVIEFAPLACPSCPTAQ